MRRRRTSTGCSALHRAYVGRVPYEDLAVQLGETAPLDEAALIGAAARRTGAAATASSSTRCWRRCCARSGSSSPTTRRWSAARGRSTTWRCSCTSTVSAGWPTPGWARATWTRCRSARARRRSAPFTYTLEREAGGSWWMGQHEWGSFSGFRMTEEESPGRGLRRPPPAPVDRPRVELRQDAGRAAAERRSHHVAARPHVLGHRPVGGHRRSCSSAEDFAEVLHEIFGITVGGERLERLWAQAVEQHEAFLARS